MTGHTSKSRRQAEKEATRGRILDAARELFVRDGIEAVTLRAIAQAIAYTPAAIYTHFADKNALLSALCAEDFRAFTQMFRAAAATEPDSVARLRALGRGYLAFALTFPDHYRLLFMTRLRDQDAQDAVRPSFQPRNPEEDAYAFLVDAVRAVHGAGRARGWNDVDAVAQMLWMALHGVVSLHLTMPADTGIPLREPNAIAEQLMDVLMGGLITPRAGDC